VVTLALFVAVLVTGALTHTIAQFKWGFALAYLGLCVPMLLGFLAGYRLTLANAARVTPGATREPDTSAERDAPHIFH
jgi:hypothetical protein